MEFFVGFILGTYYDLGDLGFADVEGRRDVLKYEIVRNFIFG